MKTNLSLPVSLSNCPPHTERRVGVRNTTLSSFGYEVVRAAILQTLHFNQPTESVSSKRSS